jgi:hypothetical protein
MAWVLVICVGAVAGCLLFASGYYFYLKMFSMRHLTVFSADSPKAPTAEQIAEAVVKKLPPNTEKNGISASASILVRHAPPKTATINKLTSENIGPRLGTGPDAYKEISDEQVAQWAVEEADKIEQLVESTFEGQIGGSYQARAWRFNNDFNDYCLKDLFDLRNELHRRLGVTANDPEEIQTWTALFPETKYPIPKRDLVSPTLAREYAHYLRRLALRLKRRTVPRREPLPLQMLLARILPDNQQFPQRILATITAPLQLKSGYVAINFEGPVAEISCDFENSELVSGYEGIENKALAQLIQTEPSKLYVLRFTKTPFIPNKPLHVVFSGKEGFRVISATFYDE